MGKSVAHIYLPSHNIYWTCEAYTMSLIGGQRGRRFKNLLMQYRIDIQYNSISKLDKLDLNE